LQSDGLFDVSRPYENKEDVLYVEVDVPEDTNNE
jgi:hypothetical protein